MAARMLAEGVARDFGTARRKAAERLGIRDQSMLPDYRALQEALQAHQRLFGGDQHLDRQRSLRSLALDAMEFLTDFQPRLVGPVLLGTACTSTITLHLYADEPEAVMRRLLDAGIQFDSLQRRLRFGTERYQACSGFRLHLDDAAGDSTEFELIVLSLRQLHQPPLNSIDGKPMLHADLAQVRELLGTG